MSSLTSVNIKNAWIVDSMKLPFQRISTDKLKDCYSYPPAIQFTPFDKKSEISVLISADSPMFTFTPMYVLGKKTNPKPLKRTQVG